MINLKSRTLQILVLLILAVVAATALYAVFESDNIGITVNTNGTDTGISYQTFLWVSVPQAMKDEIKNKADDDVQSDNSTVDSVKADLKAIATKYNYNADVKIVSQFGNDQLPMPASVNGTSMVPTLKDGQDIVVLKTTDLKVGDIVVANHPTYGLIVKRLTEIKGTQVYLKSDNRKVEISTTQMNIGNGVIETVTVEKTPLDTWLPIQNVIGVVKVY